jgi:hypothetical protein
MAEGRCMRLDAECVPGRPGCVLRGNSVFAVSAEERIAERREQTGSDDARS